MLQCNKCNKRLNIEEFGFYIRKNKEIYYMNCNKCREIQNKKNEESKKKMKEEYESRKNNNTILCNCGITYVAFREYHIQRHNNSKKHLNNLL